MMHLTHEYTFCNHPWESIRVACIKAQETAAFLCLPRVMTHTLDPEYDNN